MKKLKLKRNYFSLVELMVVITIIGLLSGIVAINVFKHVLDAKIAATRASITQFSNTADIYFMNTGKYPSALNDLYVKPEGVKGWNGPYMKGEMKMDPWKNPFVCVTNPGDKGNPFEIYSFGPDGAEGGGDDIHESDENPDGQPSSSGAASKSSESGATPAGTEPSK